MNPSRAFPPTGAQEEGAVPRLSMEETGLVLRIIKRWMRQLGIRSGYELYLLSNVPRPTFYRWLSGRVRVPVAGARHLAETLSQYANHGGPSREIEAVLEVPISGSSGLTLLVAEFRARRVPYRRAIEAIRAARFQIVPIETSAPSIQKGQ